MPTDESYLDNLLKGLTSDSGESEEDRLSAYRRPHNGEVRVSHESQEMPDFLKDYTEEDKGLQFHVVPEEKDIYPGIEDYTGEQGYFDENQDDLDLNENADDTIENYDIFEEAFDDSLIDKMIANELSEEDNPGEPFGMSEIADQQPATEALYDVSQNSDWIGAESNELAAEANETSTGAYGPDADVNEMSVAAYGAAADSFGATDNSEEADALADIFGSFSENTEEAGGEDNADVDIFQQEEATIVETPFDTSVDTSALDSLFEEEDSDSGQEVAAEPEEDAWVVDNSIEEIPAETEMEGVEETAAVEEVEEGDLADIFSGGGEPEEPQSLNDIEGLEGLSSDDINSLDGLFSELEEETEEKKGKAKAKKEKLPFLLRIFGNVPIPENKIKPEPTEEELAAKKAEAAAKKKAKKDEKKKAADEKKKAAAEAKAAKARQTAEEKAAAKALKKEQMEKLLLEDVGNTQKLNLAGCIVIFAMFAAIAALIISSINTATYNASIREAGKYFDDALDNENPDLYTEAYNQLLGLRIKDKDKILEDKVYTVNFVNVEITSFTNHYAMGDKVTALSDLLNGVLIYNFYIDHAYELEIEDHLLYLRSILIGLLKSEYDIEEDEAVKVIHNYEDLEKKQGELAAKRYLTMYIHEVVDNLPKEE